MGKWLCTQMLGCLPMVTLLSPPLPPQHLFPDSESSARVEEPLRKASQHHPHLHPHQVHHPPQLQPPSHHPHLSLGICSHHHQGTWLCPHRTSAFQVSAAVSGDAGVLISNTSAVRGLCSTWSPLAFTEFVLQSPMTSSHHCHHHQCCPTLRISPHHHHHQQLQRNPSAPHRATWTKVQQLQGQIC